MVSSLILIALALFTFSASADSTHQRHRRLVRKSGNCTERSYPSFSLQDKYQGSGFFDEWDFWSYSDPTHGYVNYVDSSDAWSKGLVSTTSNQATMKVDNWTWLGEGQGRDSVRIQSQKAYGGGLIILDIDAMPYGCALWPAFWTVGQNWPEDGEIDIVEAVNGGSNNQMTLHTSPGCTQSSSMSITGYVLSTDCNANDNSNAGCGILDTDSSSSGAGLAAAGGSVFATLWDGDGVQIWQFARADVPSDITAGKPTPGGWGSPKAQWSSGTCSPYTYLQPQNLVFDTTLCGDWAGSAYSGAGCPGTCESQVMDPNNFNTAAWVVNYVAVYQESS